MYDKFNEELDKYKKEEWVTFRKKASDGNDYFAF